MAKKHGNAKPSELTDEQARRIYENARKERAAITELEVDRIEEAHAHDEFGVVRRVSLMALTRPCDELFKAIDDDRDVAVGFAAVLDGLNSYVDWLTAVKATMETARARLVVGLCARDDVEQVMAEAKHDNEATAHGQH